ncbi:MAG: NAD(P)/FAD-dependent oxidoreductase [Alphaproteobacteria bacterium]
MTGRIPLQEVRDWLSAFEKALTAQDGDAVAAMFAEVDASWRDLVAFTWNIATVEGRDAIAEMVKAQAGAALPVTITPKDDVTFADGMAQGWFDFETKTARGKGFVRLKNGKAWTLLTAMEELKGFEEPKGRRRPEGVEHKAVKNRVTWTDKREEIERTLGYETQPYCLIVGGSQGGLALGARMKRLNVPTLIVDALPKPGDAWRSRYKSLCLHDPIWVDHLPYLQFPDHWPVYTPKDKMGDWLEAYCKAMELDFWGSTRCQKAAFDEVTKTWTVQVEREGKLVVLRPKQLVLATGLSGMPMVPTFPGADTFEGVQYHTSQHVEAAGFNGKKCVVIGANNSAHDVCVDLWSAGADVTMIQRSPTTVVKVTALRRLVEEGLYSEGALARGIDQDKADLMVASLTHRMRESIDKINCARVRREDAEFYEKLAATGFMFDFGQDNTAINGKYMRRASGYYIDVGGSDLIIQGEIKVKSRVGVTEIKKHSVVLTDGTELPADLIVYATGFGPMDSWAEILISKEVRDKVGPCWGLGSDTEYDPGPWEGELRNMWKPTGQEALWFQGGNLVQSRFHSLHLALQIKARMEGLDTPVFKTQPIVRPALVPA